MDRRRGIGWNISGVVEAQLRYQQSTCAGIGRNEDNVDVLAPPWLEFQRQTQVCRQPLTALIAVANVQQRGDGEGEVLAAGVVAPELQELPAQRFELGAKTTEQAKTPLAVLD